MTAFWQSMIKARAQVVFGDFNKRAYRNIHNEEDRANNVMKHWLEVAFRSCGGEVEFSMLRADVGTCPGQQILACGAEDDTMLHFLLDYKDVDFKIRKQRISQSAAPLDNGSLCWKSTDQDWHRLILLHVRSSIETSGCRQRTPEAKLKRKVRDNDRRRAKFLKGPPVRTHG